MSKRRLVALVVCIAVAHGPLLIMHAVWFLLRLPLFLTPCAKFSSPIRILMIFGAQVAGLLAGLSAVVYGPAYFVACKVLGTARPDPQFLLVMTFLLSVLMGCVLFLWWTWKQGKSESGSGGRTQAVPLLPEGAPSGKR